LIARFVVAQQPLAWTPPAPEVRELQALVRRLEALTEMRVAEQNRLEAIIAFEIVKSSVEEHIGYLDKQIKQTQAAISQHINSHPDLRRQSELLDSIPGIAETTAAATLSRDRGCHPISKCAPSRRLRRTGAARTIFGEFGAGADTTINDR
jgi:transposase